MKKTIRVTESELTSIIKRILREEYVDNTFNPYNEDYLDAWLGVGDEDMESYYESGVNGVIPSIIEEVKELKFPLRIYRGLRLHPKDKNQKYDLVSHSHYDNTSWTTKLSVAKEFGNVIYTGIVESPEDVDLNYTIYRRILHKPLGEYEIVLKGNNLIKDVKRFNISEQSEDFDFRHIVGDGEEMTQDKLKELLSAMKSQLSSFEEKHKDVLDVHKSFKNRLAQEKELENLKFNLTFAKNRNSPPTLRAGVRWPFEYKGKMPKNNRINVYVGNMRMFPQGLETPNIQEISKKIISNKIRNNSSYPKVEL